MNSTDLIIDAIRDHLEAVADTPLSTCSFRIRDDATERSFPRCRVSERSIEEHEILLGVYTAQVEVSIQTNPTDTTDDTHRNMVEEAWNIVADEDIEASLSSVGTLACQDVRCAGPITVIEDSYRFTSLDLTVVFNA